MEHLITTEEFKQLARPTSIHLDDAHVIAYITEVEDANIIPAIGYEAYKAIIEAEELTPEQNILLNGGEFEGTNGRPCAQSSLQRCKGLKATTAYYAYARMLRADGAIVSRAGFMQHEDEYSRHFDDSKLKQYNDVMDIAERYLASCLAYLNTIQPTPKAKGSRARIYAIGD